MKFFLAAASTAFVALLPSFVTANPFSVTGPASLPGTWNTAVLGSNDIAFTFALGPYTQTTPGFSVAYEDCDGSLLQDGAYTVTGTNFGATVTLTNPSAAYTAEQWCVKVTLSAPNGPLAILEYTVSITVNDDGTIDDLSASNNNLELPVADDVDGTGSLLDLAFDPFADGTYAALASIDNNPLVLGVDETMTITVDLNEPNSLYFCKITAIDIVTPNVGSVTLSTVLVGGVDSGVNKGFCKATVPVTGIPLSAWGGTPSGTVSVNVDVAWAANSADLPSRRLRALEDGSSAGIPVDASGTTVVTVTGDLLVQNEPLSTAAIAGIAAAAGIIFFLVVFTMWRQGCFEDKRAAAAAKPPKTVCVDEENSATTGSDVQA